MCMYNVLSTSLLWCFTVNFQTLDRRCNTMLPPAKALLLAQVLMTMSDKDAVSKASQADARCHAYISKHPHLRNALGNWMITVISCCGCILLYAAVFCGYDSLSLLMCFMSMLWQGRHQ